MAKVITRDEARQLIEQEQSGKIFTVTFVARKGGHRRTMNCRTGVQKKVSGKGLKFDPKAQGLKSVYDVQLKQHRFVSLEEITHIRMRNKEYDVI